MSPLSTTTYQVMFSETATYVVAIKAPDAEAALDFAQSVYEARGSEVFTLVARRGDDWTATPAKEAAR